MDGKKISYMYLYMDYKDELLIYLQKIYMSFPSWCRVCGNSYKL
jgi:hypothetical protein